MISIFNQFFASLENWGTLNKIRICSLFFGNQCCYVNIAKCYLLVENITEVLALWIVIMRLAHSFFRHRGVMVDVEYTVLVFVLMILFVKNDKTSDIV